mgnify:CR=1 FL=1
MSGAGTFKIPQSVLVVIHTPALDVLLIRRADATDFWQSVTGSKDSPEENYAQTAVREVLEETNITVGDVRYVASQPWPFPASLMMGFIGDATSDTITIDPHELDAAIWVSREDMMDIMAGEHPTIRPARKGAIAYHLIARWLADKIET